MVDEDDVGRVAQATADYWAANPVAGTRKRVVIGFDRRFLSDQFARRSAEVFLGNGFEVVLTDRPTPTPSVSYAVRAMKAVGGVMITASHNPPSFNGFKLKAHFGGSAEPSMCQGVESLLDRNPVARVPVAKNAPVKIADIRPAHYAAIKKLGPSQIEALDMGRRGDADVVFVHARALEEKFVAEGFGVKRFEVMYNDFVLVGPKSDPAKVGGTKDIVAALQKMMVVKAKVRRGGEIVASERLPRELLAGEQADPRIGRARHQLFEHFGRLLA